MLGLYLVATAAFLLALAQHGGRTAARFELSAMVTGGLALAAGHLLNRRYLTPTRIVRARPAASASSARFDRAAVEAEDFGGRHVAAGPGVDDPGIPPQHGFGVEAALLERRRQLRRLAAAEAASDAGWYSRRIRIWRAHWPSSRTLPGQA